MKKRILLLGLVMALIAMLVMPFTASAKPVNFSGNGILNSIDEGQSTPMEGSPLYNGIPVFWNVADRHIQGEFIKTTIGKSNKINGPFTLTYGGVFNLFDQSGSFTGTLKTKSVTFSVTGNTAPLVAPVVVVLNKDVTLTTGSVNFLTGYVPAGTTLTKGTVLAVCQLNVSGDWVGVKGLKDAGTFNATINFMPTPDNHVGTIVNSTFTLAGNYSD